MGQEVPARRVLVIDSDDQRASGLAAFLRGQGIEIERARDQEDGWRRFVASRPSIVLAELTATGEDGRGDRFLRRLQSEYMGAMPSTFFVCRAEDVTAAQALEPDGILVAPIAAEALAGVLVEQVALGDSAARQATRLRELYDLSLLGADLYRAVDTLVARAALAFHVTDCVIWSGANDGHWPRNARHQPPSDPALYLEQCRLAVDAGVTLFGAARAPAGAIVVDQPGRSFLGAPLGQLGQATRGGICLVSDESRRFTSDERDALRVLARRTAHELAWVTAHRRMIAEQEKLRESALIDPLSGVWTRAALEQAVAGQMVSARRRGESLCLAVIDLVALRAVNDRYGHVVGDRVLGHYAHAVRTGLRVQDMIGRLGGDDLAVLLIGCDLTAARGLIEQVEEGLAGSPFREHGLTIPVHIRTGLTAIRPDEPNIEGVLGRALDGVRHARRSGESIHVSDPARDWSTPSDVLSLGHERGLPSGATLGGMYRVLHEISRGAMGVVYRGEDLGLGRPVAIKVMRSDLAQDKELVARFRDEAAMLGALHHVNLVQVHAFGSEGEDVYFVMELVEGEPLSDVILRFGDQNAHLPLETVEKIVDEIADALEAIHALGIIHRDVKPSNVLLDRLNDRAVLVDVGVAKRRDDHGDSAGTPGFAAPESFLDEGETPATDVYGLATTAYTMLTGIAPYGGGEVADVVNRQLYERAVPPSRLREGLSPEIDDVLFKALSPEQHDRFQTAASFAIALGQALDRESSGDTPLPRKLRARRREQALQRRGGIASGSPTATPLPVTETVRELEDEPSRRIACSRGAWFRVAHKLLSHHLGADWVVRTARADPRLDAVLSPQLSPMSWQPFDLLCTLLIGAASSVRDGHKLARSLGRITITATLPRFFGADPAAQSPLALLRAAESYWARYHSWGKLAVRADNGIAVVELSGSPGEPLICSLVEASLGRIAELAGARNTTTHHPQCVRDGNPACMFSVRWSAR